MENSFLNKQFETFKTLSTKAEKDAFLKDYKKSFDILNEEEKNAAQENWEGNIVAIKNRVQEIRKEIEDKKSIITVKDKEERQLIEILLKKMNIQFELQY